MSKYSLRRILDEELVSKNLACTRLVINALDFCLFPDRFHYVPLKPRLCIDKYEQVVVLTGGQDDDDLNVETDCFVPSTKTWVSLPMMPYPCLENAAAVCCGILYIMGAKREESTSICCFNPKQYKWSSHDIDLTFKTDYSVTCFNEELYVIGGEDSWSDVKIYNPVPNEWRTAASMGTGRAGHSAVVLQEHIDVIGGHDGSVCQNSAECYNPLTDQWSRISNLSKARRYASVATVCEKIIIVGGFGHRRERTIEPSCEIFDPNTNQWNLVCSPHIPCAASSAVSVNDIVYLFGGESETDYLKAVECFDIKKNKWYAIGCLPNARSYLQASLIKLPKSFIQ